MLQLVFCLFIQFLLLQHQVASAIDWRRSLVRFSLFDQAYHRFVAQFNDKDDGSSEADRNRVSENREMTYFEEAPAGNGVWETQLIPCSFTDGRYRIRLAQTNLYFSAGNSITETEEMLQLTASRGAAITWVVQQQPGLFHFPAYSIETNYNGIGPYSLDLDHMKIFRLGIYPMSRKGHIFNCNCRPDKTDRSKCNAEAGVYLRIADRHWFVEQEPTDSDVHLRFRNETMPTTEWDFERLP